MVLGSKEVLDSETLNAYGATTLEKYDATLVWLNELSGHSRGNLVLEHSCHGISSG